ncbi:MAG: patatin-like phospholipase family protein, partial [Xanthobacteraceae bacterium]
MPPATSRAPTTRSTAAGPRSERAAIAPRSFMATARWLSNLIPGRTGTTIKNINLALQGGGAHGAFTWGVLDHLLADGRLAIEGISGASAGAMN